MIFFYKIQNEYFSFIKIFSESTDIVIDKKYRRVKV